MDVKTAIRNGDAAALRQLLAGDSSRANELIRWEKGSRASPIRSILFRICCLKARCHGERQSRSLT
jgi:hypothetical protein